MPVTKYYMYIYFLHVFFLWRCRQEVNLSLFPDLFLGSGALLCRFFTFSCVFWGIICRDMQPSWQLLSGLFLDVSVGPVKTFTSCGEPGVWEQNGINLWGFLSLLVWIWVCWSSTALEVWSWYSHSKISLIYEIFTYLWWKLWYTWFFLCSSHQPLLWATLKLYFSSVILTSFPRSSLRD